MNENAQTRALENQQRGTYSALGERIDWTYYDFAKIDGTTPVLVHRLFAQGLATGKTLDQTNMTTSGIIPQGQKLKVFNIKCFYTSRSVKATADLQSLYTMIDTTTFEFKIPGKDSLGTWKLNEMLGLPVMFALTPSVAGDNIPLSSIGRYHGIFPLNVPIPLAALTPFEVKITHHATPATALDNDVFTVGLNGILLRAS